MNQGLTFEREALDTLNIAKKAAARSSVTETAGVCVPSLSGIDPGEFPPGIWMMRYPHYFLYVWHMLGSVQRDSSGRI